MRARPLVIETPVKAGRVSLLDSMLPALREAILAGRVIVLVARNSANGGAGARKACVLDAQQLVEDLAKFGIDVRHLMPDAEVLESWLRSAPALPSVDARSGAPFRNRFVEIWLCPQVLLIMSIGTGSRQDEETLAQPFLEYLGERVRELRPTLLHGKRWDRVGRRKWGLGPSLDAMKTRQPAFIGDEDGIIPLDQSAELIAFIKSNQAEQFAAGIPLQTRRGMRSRTGAVMIDGRVPYALASVPPPGFCRLRMIDSGVGASGQMTMFLESPKYLPPRSHVSVGYPAVIDPVTGDVVDQVDNVRWALEKLADPSWTYKAIGEGLVARQFSHTKIREQRGLDAVVRPYRAKPGREMSHRYSAQLIVGAIRNNLDVYETGRILRTLGVDGIDDVEIEGLVPPDGPWATPEVFARIRARIEKRVTKHGRNAMLLSGLPVTVDGHQYVLRGRAHQGPVYAIWDGTAERSLTLHAMLDHQSLARLVAQALDTAVREGLRLPSLADTTALDGSIERANQLIDSAILRLREAQTRLDLVYDRVNDPRSDGPLLERLNGEYNALSRITIPELEREVFLARDQHRQLLADKEWSHGVPAESLDRLVRILAEPQGTAHRDEIFRLITGLDLRFERFHHRYFRGYTVHATVDLALRDADDEVYVLHYQGTFPLGGKTLFNEHVEQLIQGMREGGLYRDLEQQFPGVSRTALRDILGMSTSEGWILSISDPRLMRLAFALFEKTRREDCPPDEAVRKVAAQFDEPPQLVSRLWSLYGPEGSATAQWRRKLYPSERQATACHRCTNQTRFWPLLREIDTGVCPQCRFDASDVTWDASCDCHLVEKTPEGYRTLTGQVPIRTGRPRRSG